MPNFGELFYFTIKKMKIITLFLVFCSSILFGQELTLTPKKMPFYDIIEWPNNGVLVFGKDYKGNTVQQEISFINDAGEVKWQEQYLPQVAEPKIILSEYSDYLYFLDQLQPENGKIFYNQTNLSGYIRKGSIYFPPIFRTVSDIDYSSCELIDIVSATDDLIFHFRLKDKKNKVYQDVLVFLNHYSLKTFIAKVPGVFGFDVVDSGQKSLVYFAGSKDNENYFVHHTKKDNKSGYDVLIFDKKGAFTGSRFLVTPDSDISVSSRFSIYPSGSYYSNNTIHAAKGQLFFFDNDWYLLGCKANSFSIWKYVDGKPTKILTDFSIQTKKNPEHQIGVTVLRNKFVIVVKSDLETKGIVVNEDGSIVQEHIITGGTLGSNISNLFHSTVNQNFLYLFNDVWHSVNKITFEETLTPLVFEKQ